VNEGQQNSNGKLPETKKLKKVNFMKNIPRFVRRFTNTYFKYNSLLISRKEEPGGWNQKASKPIPLFLQREIRETENRPLYIIVSSFTE
jgi:hypothetical protein